MNPFIYSSGFDFGYNNQMLFEDRKVSIKAGDRILLIGPNGSGKTTLLRLLCGSLLPDRGSIEVHGALHCVLTPFGYFKDSYSIKNNLKLLWLDNAQLKGLCFNEVCDMFCQFSRLNERRLDDPLYELSVGERMRLPIFALANSNADIYLLDEFIGGVDDEFWQNTREVVERKILEAKIVIIASHNLGLGKKFQCTPVSVEEILEAND